MSDEQTSISCMLFFSMTPLAGCCGIDWTMRRLKSGANTEDRNVFILNSNSYSLLKISLPKIKPQILNLLSNILSNIFNVPFLSFIFDFVI